MTLHLGAFSVPFGRNRVTVKRKADNRQGAGKVRDRAATFNGRHSVLVGRGSGTQNITIWWR